MLLQRAYKNVVTTVVTAYKNKTYKNVVTTYKGLRPQTLITTGGWGLRPHTTVCGTFEYTSLLNTSPKLDISIFYRLVFALSLYQNPG